MDSRLDPTCSGITIYLVTLPRIARGTWPIDPTPRIGSVTHDPASGCTAAARLSDCIRHPESAFAVKHGGGGRQAHKAFSVHVSAAGSNERTARDGKRHKCLGDMSYIAGETWQRHKVYIRMLVSSYQRLAPTVRCSRASLGLGLQPRPILTTTFQGFWSQRDEVGSGRG